MKITLDQLVVIMIFHAFFAKYVLNNTSNMECVNKCVILLIMNNRIG